MTTTTATFVRSIHDDAPCPTWGRVLGREDADRVAVAWGDAAYADDPWAEARIEFADELAVAPTSGASTAVGAPTSSAGAATPAAPPSTDRLLTTAEVCAMFRVTDRTLRNWRATGRIRAAKTDGPPIRYAESAVRALLAGSAK